VSAAGAAQVRPSARELMLLAWLWGGAAGVRALKYIMPLRVLVALARAGVRVRPSAAKTAQLMDAAVRGRLGRWRVPGNCLERSLVFYRLLLGSGAEPHLVIGMRPPGIDAPRHAGAPGHVWIMVADVRVGASEDEESFMPVVAFDAAGRRYEPCATVNA
jgi:hypothetical protein